MLDIITILIVWPRSLLFGLLFTLSDFLEYPRQDLRVCTEKVKRPT